MIPVALDLFRAQSCGQAVELLERCPHSAFSIHFLRGVYSHTPNGYQCTRQEDDTEGNQKEPRFVAHAATPDFREEGGGSACKKSVEW